MKPSLMSLHSSVLQNVFKYLPKSDAFSLFMANKQANKSGHYYFQTLYHLLNLDFNSTVADTSKFVRNLFSRKAITISADAIQDKAPDVAIIPEITYIDYLLLLPSNVIVGQTFGGGLIFYSNEQSKFEIVEQNDTICSNKIAGYNNLLVLSHKAVIEFTLQKSKLVKKGQFTKIEEEIVDIAATSTFNYALSNKNKLHIWKDETYRIIDLHETNITQISGELTRIYMLGINAKVYCIDESKQKDILMLAYEEHKEMSHLKLTSIISGPMFTIGLNKVVTPELNKWTTEELCERLAVGIFEKVGKIIKYSKLKGSDIENATEAFVSDTLGITLINEKQKFMNTVQRLKEPTVATLIYGLGANNHGQLGNKNYIHIVSPIKIPLPSLDVNEYIEKVVPCVMSLIVITNKCRGYVIGNCDKSTPKAPEWSQINPQDGSDIIAGICIATQKKKEIICVYHREGKQATKPFKPVDKILQQIKWDTHLNSTEFTIGYEDRFLGILEVAYQQFTEAEIPFHRIHYIKRLNKIVWDRKLKLNLI